MFSLVICAAIYACNNSIAARIMINKNLRLKIVYATRAWAITALTMDLVKVRLNFKDKAALQ